MACALYRYWDAQGRLLYVGISRSAVARLISHAKDDWHNQITRIDVEMHNDRPTALAAEQRAIIGERPLHNKHHNGTKAAERFARREAAESKREVAARRAVIDRALVLRLLSTVPASSQMVWSLHAARALRVRHAELTAAERVGALPTAGHRRGAFLGWAKRHLEDCIDGPRGGANATP
jgi:hypothetical protein